MAPIFRRLGWLTLPAAVALGALAAGANPLGLQNGDVIDTIEWDALRSQGDGGSFSSVLQELFTDGRITNVDVERAPAFPPTLTSLPQTNVTFTFAVELVSSGIFAGGNLVTVWRGSNLTDPDVTVLQNGNVILTGDFQANFVFGGFISQTSLTSRGNISVTGGDPGLLAAIGSLAILELSASVFGFDPPLNALLADNIAGNEDFTVEFSGTLRPANPSPFVPEPATAILVAGGLLGLLGVGRRRSR